MKNRIRSKRGFTLIELIELMIVIITVGMLASIIIPHFQKYKERYDRLNNEVIYEQAPVKSIEDKETVDETGECNKL